MMNSAEQVIDLHKSSLAAWTDLSVAAMTGLERWVSLHIDVVRSILDGSVEQSRRLGHLGEPQDLLAFMTTMGQPAMAAGLTYAQESFQIAQATVAELTTIFDQRWRGFPMASPFQSAFNGSFAPPAASENGPKGARPPARAHA